MNKLRFKFCIVALLCIPAVADAGLLSWLFGPSAAEKYQRDTGSNLTFQARSVIAAKMRVEQKTAIQVGVIHSSITMTVEDKSWIGTVGVTIKANYSATYGLPFDMIEKGIRVEKDYAATGLIVVVSAPIPLSVAVDTRSVYVDSRQRTGIRTWMKVDELQIDAERGFTEQASLDAQVLCRHQDALDMTRAVVRDVVLDMASQIYSKKMSRVLAPRTTVIFENEINLEDFRSRTEPHPPSG